MSYVRHSGFLFSVSCGVLIAASSLSPVLPAAAEPAPAKSPLTFDASLRVRYEHADWFGPAQSDLNYGFWHSKLLFGAGYTAESVRIYMQGEYFQLYNLPEGASGPGATYFAANDMDENPGNVALRQAFLEVKNSDVEAIAGRFLYSNGSEAMPKQPALAAIRAKRVSQRLIGPFDFTAGRSFDGGRLTIPASAGSFTGLYVMPTQGGFESDLNLTIYDIRVGGLSWTAPWSADAQAHDDMQIFAYYYGDDRDVTKVDNRPLAARTEDGENIEVTTVGAHWIRKWTSTDIQIDSLLWGGMQWGDWGEEDHQAYSFTAEVGARLETSSWKPGARLGYTYGSGDDDTTDGKHQTFFQMLPTARAYAATPFYNMQNMADLFMQVSAQPLQSMAIKSELHRLWLAESEDLLYSGGGANERRDRFGYAGLPSGGSHDVGTLLDIEATWTFTPNVSASVYYGHLFGGSATKAAANSPSNDIDYVFAEMLFKY